MKQSNADYWNYLSGILSDTLGIKVTTEQAHTIFNQVILSVPEYLSKNGTDKIAIRNIGVFRIVTGTTRNGNSIKRFKFRASGMMLKYLDYIHDPENEQNRQAVREILSRKRRASEMIASAADKVLLVHSKESDNEALERIESEITELRSVMTNSAIRAKTPTASTLKVISKPSAAPSQPTPAVPDKASAALLGDSDFDPDIEMDDWMACFDESSPPPPAQPPEHIPTYAMKPAKTPHFTINVSEKDTPPWDSSPPSAAASALAEEEFSAEDVNTLSKNILSLDY